MDSDLKDFQFNLDNHQHLQSQNPHSATTLDTKLQEYPPPISTVGNIYQTISQANHLPALSESSSTSSSTPSNTATSASTPSTQHSSSSNKKSSHQQNPVTSAVILADITLTPGSGVHLQKSPCCALIASTSSTASNTLTSAPSSSITDFQRDYWYSHHHNPGHHHYHPAHTHPHHHNFHHATQLVEDLAVYSTPSSAMSKFGLESPADGYLNSRYNANVKGARNERTSSFFDIPAVTHPYCYRFPSSPPAEILKKTDEGNNLDTGFCTNSATAPLQLAHFHHSKIIEHPDSTTNLNQHQIHHLHHTHSQQHAGQSGLKCSTSSSSSSGSNFAAVSASYNHYNTGYNVRQPNETTTSSSAVSSTEPEIKFESPYNTAVSYSLRPAGESSVVSSTESEFKLESLYTTACNPISTSNAVTQRRGSLQLWQFLVALLDEPSTSSGCIAWTGRGMEFKLIEPEEVARLWGIQKNRPAMNYDKLSRSLRYYYEKGIMQKVNGERYVYRFVCDPDALFNMAYGHLNSANGKSEQSHYITTAAVAAVSPSKNGITSTRISSFDRINSSSRASNTLERGRSDSVFYNKY